MGHFLSLCVCVREAGRRVLSSSGCLGTHSVAQAQFRFTGILLPLPPKWWACSTIAWLVRAFSYMSIIMFCSQSPVPLPPHSAADPSLCSLLAYVASEGMLYVILTSMSQFSLRLSDVLIKNNNKNLLS